MPTIITNKQKQRNIIINAMQQKEGLKRLNGLHKSYKINMERYILLFRLCPDLARKGNNPIETLIFRVYNGSLLWMLEINDWVIETLRQRSGVEGTDNALCDMIYHAIEANEFNVVRNNIRLTINLQFQLGRGVFVKGAIELGDALPVVQDEDFKMVNQMFLFDLYDTLTTNIPKPYLPQHEVGLRSKATIPINEPVQQQSQQQQQNQQIEDILKGNNKSIKPNADMIRPNMKKRKGVGAKLG